MLARLQSIRDYIMEQRAGENAAELAAREQARADGSGSAAVQTSTALIPAGAGGNKKKASSSEGAAKIVAFPLSPTPMALSPAVIATAPQTSVAVLPQNDASESIDDGNNRNEDSALSSAGVSLLPGQLQVDSAALTALEDQRLDVGIDDAASAEILARDPQLSTIIFNEAVLYCRLGHFRSSLRRLDLLFKNLVILDSMLVIRVCYLCLDIYFLVFRGLNPKSPHLQVLEVCAGEVLEALAFREAQDFGTEDEEPDDERGDEDQKKVDAEAAPERQARLKFNIRLYRAKLKLIVSNSKDAKKEIKSALEVYEKEVKPCLSSEEQRTAPALFLKANLEYLRGNFRKCVKLLNASMGDGSLGKAMHLNNLACVNFRSQKYALATICFAQSLSLMKEQGGTGKNATRLVLDISRCEVLYNVGLQLLAAGKELGTALDCFYRSSMHLHMRPRLWIRMSECCIYAHDGQRQAVSQDRVASSNHETTITSETLTGEFQNDLVAAVVGGTRAGGQDWVHPCRRILLPLNAPGDEQSRHKGEGDAARSRGGAELTLTFASMCLENALALLSSDRFREESSRTTPADSISKRTGKKNVHGPHSGYALRLRQAALAKMSYCALCQDHPVRALECAQELLSVSSEAAAGAATHRYFAHTYAAEALCMMDKSSEALNHAIKAEEALAELDAIKAEAVSSKSRDPEGTTQPDLPLSGLVAHPRPLALRSALCVNLATVRLQQGELGLAEQSLKKALSLRPSSNDAIRTLLYLRLRQGDAKEALRLLQERRPR
jgi:CCR4-NOT transcription complex subunit 10